MSKCSKRVNEIKRLLDEVSGLDDYVVYLSLTSIYYFTLLAVNDLKEYESADKLNGTIFSKNN